MSPTVGDTSIVVVDDSKEVDALDLHIVNGRISSRATIDFATAIRKESEGPKEAVADLKRMNNDSMRRPTSET